MLRHMLDVACVQGTIYERSAKSRERAAGVPRRRLLVLALLKESISTGNQGRRKVVRYTHIAEEEYGRSRELACKL